MSSNLHRRCVDHGCRRAIPCPTEGRYFLLDFESAPAERPADRVDERRHALAPVVWIDPADLAELQTKENRDHAHNWTLTAKQIGRCTSPLYATPPTEPAPQAEPAAQMQPLRLTRDQIDKIFDQHREAPTLQFRYLVADAILAELQRRPCWQVNSGTPCNMLRAPGERRCPDCNPGAKS